MHCDMEGASALYLEEPVLHDDDPYRFFRW